MLQLFKLLIFNFRDFMTVDGSPFLNSPPSLSFISTPFSLKTIFSVDIFFIREKRFKGSQKNFINTYIV